MKVKSLTIALCLGVFSVLSAQSNYNPLLYNVPFLDADVKIQSAGMGGIGVVASGINFETAYNQNPALLARGTHQFDVHATYAPISTNIDGDNSPFLSIAGFYAIDEQQSIGLSEKYFSSNIVPNMFENYFGITYAIAPVRDFSIGATAKYIISRVLPVDIGETAHSYAIDFGLDYRKVIEITDNNYFRWNIATSITNIGPKITYYLEGVAPRVIPTNWRFGTMVSYKFVVDGYNSLNINIAYQGEKLLVPTPNTIDSDNNQVFDYLERSVMNGLFNSFSDALRDGEEAEEFLHRVGLEVRMDLEDIEGFIAFRGGLIRQHENKGNQRLYTFGGSFNYRGFFVEIADQTYQESVGIANPPLSFGVGFQYRMQ